MVHSLPYRVRRACRHPQLHQPVLGRTGSLVPGVDKRLDRIDPLSPVRQVDCVASVQLPGTSPTDAVLLHRPVLRALRVRPGPGGGGAGPAVVPPRRKCPREPLIPPEGGRRSTESEAQVSAWRGIGRRRTGRSASTSGGAGVEPGDVKHGLTFPEVAVFHEPCAQVPLHGAEPVCGFRLSARSTGRWCRSRGSNPDGLAPAGF
jgi:hypothetical protein